MDKGPGSIQACQTSSKVVVSQETREGAVTSFLIISARLASDSSSKLRIACSPDPDGLYVLARYEL